MELMSAGFTVRTASGGRVRLIALVTVPLAIVRIGIAQEVR